MQSNGYILSIDQGTSSTKCLIVDGEGKVLAKGNAVLQSIYPGDGFVEQDAIGISTNVQEAVQQCLALFESKGFKKNEIAGIGISNQRETFVVWDETGKPLHNAVVWQCKRSISICEQLEEDGTYDIIHRKTGLFTDPYFSATKLVWLVRNSRTLQNVLAAGKLRFGTIDTWLLYNFTHGKVFATDHTNASRTMLFNIHSLEWDNELIEIMGLKGIRLAEIKSSSSYYGETDLNGLLEKPVPVLAMVGDSHAAAFGEGCFEPGYAKATLGTGCSLMMNVGNKPVLSANGMVSTICWSIDGRIDYALEGVIVTCGATLEWMKNNLNLFDDAAQTAEVANELANNDGVYLVPAFSGLGSPHWDKNRRASITGMTFDTNKKHLIRAALESIPYQVKDVLDAMAKESVPVKALMIDGGISVNPFVVEFLTGVLGREVYTIGMPDISALGAAYLAGLKAGIYKDINALKELGNVKTKHQPSPDTTVQQEGYKGWQKAIREGASK